MVRVFVRAAVHWRLKVSAMWQLAQITRLWRTRPGTRYRWVPSALYSTGCILKTGYAACIAISSFKDETVGEQSRYSPLGFLSIRRLLIFAGQLRSKQGPCGDVSTNPPYFSSLRSRLSPSRPSRYKHSTAKSTARKAFLSESIFLKALFFGSFFSKALFTKGFFSKGLFSDGRFTNIFVERVVSWIAFEKAFERQKCLPLNLWRGCVIRVAPHGWYCRTGS